MKVDLLCRQRGTRAPKFQNIHNATNYHLQFERSCRETESQAFQKVLLIRKDLRSTETANHLPSPVPSVQFIGERVHSILSRLSIIVGHPLRNRSQDVPKGMNTLETEKSPRKELKHVTTTRINERM